MAVFACTIAGAQPFTIDNVSADSVNSTWTWVSGSTWDLSLEIAHSSASGNDPPAEVNVVVNQGETPSLRYMVVKIV